MKKFPIGLQVYTVRDAAEKDFKKTMEEVKAMGYDFVELAGLYGQSPETVKQILDEVGINALSAHVPLVELMGDMDKVVSDYPEVIGCKFIVVPFLPDELRPKTEGFATVMEVLPKLGEVCNKHNATLLYHNHDFEFVKMDDGQYALDYMYATVPANLLQTELDCCWINVAGENPSDYIKKYAGRCPVVHLKDFYKEGKPANMYELIGEEDKKSDEAGEGVFEFRPVGHGMQDFPSILKASEESGAGYVVVEQDLSYNRTSLEAAKMSIDYLHSIGL